jgi:hypothetical protein
MMKILFLALSLLSNEADVLREMRAFPATLR